MANKKVSRERAAPNKAGTAVKIVGLLLILVLVAAAVVFAFQTDGFTRFEYITAGGKKVEKRTELQIGEITRFEIKSVNPIAGKSEADIKVYANTDADFLFTVDGNPNKYKGVGELTDCFDIETGQGYFSVSLTKYKTMREILQSKYGSGVNGSTSWENGAYFLLQVITDSSEYRIALKVNGLESGFTGISTDVTGIELDQTEVIF